MQKEAIEAYDGLVPKDRLVVDAVIVALVQKDLEILLITEQVKDLVTKLSGD